MKHELYDIWDGESVGRTVGGELRWRLQLINCVAYFDSRENAEFYVAAVKKERERESR